MVLGRVSTSVIAGGIADVKTFAHEPEFYAYGMMIALWCVGGWNPEPVFPDHLISARVLRIRHDGHTAVWRVAAHTAVEP